MGTCDGRTQSARACKPVLLHLALRTLGFRTSVFGSENLGLRTSINGHWVSLWGPGFQDLDKWALGFTLRTWVSGPRKLSILRSSYLFPVTFFPRPVFSSLFSTSTVTFLCVQWSHTDTIRMCLQVRPGRFRHRKCYPMVSYRPGRFYRKKRKQNTQSPNPHELSEFIYKIVRQEDLLVNNINIMYGHEKTHVNYIYIYIYIYISLYVDG